ncbi:chloroplast lipoate protein ligase [Coprinopsis cinerea AmutBmut pab1-1]|nr:chloroplast lipoate protein ligase [Coprinopsis cinerea AmutBmut pab1-1]
MRLPPIAYHVFRRPLPYQPTWNLQEKIHQIQLQQRRESSNHKDLLLLLEHRPVYTSGRRQTEPYIKDERERLTQIGADFVTATRGGQLTYHGPGQIVGYPLLDLSRYSPVMGARDYVCRMERLLQIHLKEAHAVDHCPSEHTGVFLDPRTKVASIGVQVRHRLTSHGFAINVTQEPCRWFDRIVACGLDDVRAGSIEGASGKALTVEGEMPGLIERFGRLYERDMVTLDLTEDSPINRAILVLEEEASAMGSWNRAPLDSH